MRTLLEIGLFFDALSLSPRASNREIIDRILLLREEFRDDIEMAELLIKAKDYLTVKRKLYEGEISPCLDYIRILLRKRYGKEAEDFVIKHKLLKIEDIEQRVLPSKKKIPSSTEILEKSDFGVKNLLESLQNNPSLLEKFPLKDKIGFIEVLLQAGSEDLDYLYFDGECDNSTLSRQRALEIALKVFQYLPEDTSLLHSLGFSLLKLGDYERALTCFLKQSEKSAEDGNVWNNIAWCLMRLGRYEEALIPSKRALELLSNSADVRYVYATILTELGHWDKAIGEIKNAISNLKPSELELLELYYLLPFVLERRGDITSAIFHWKQYLKLATGKRGHERAVLRVRNKLQEKGINLEMFQSGLEAIVSYPDLRKISEEIFSNVSKLLERLPKLKVFARTLRSLMEEMPVQFSMADLEHLASLLESQAHEVRQKIEKDINDLIAEIDSLIPLTFIRDYL